MENRISGLKAILVVGAFAIANAAQADDGEKTWTAEEQAVIDAVSKGPVGIDKDFEAWAGGYAADWSFWRLGDAAIRERDVHMKLVKDYIDGGARVTGFDLTPVDVIVHGDAALIRLNAVESIIEADGAERTVRYSSAGFLIREDGVWRLAASNLYFPPAETE